MIRLLGFSLLPYVYDCLIIHLVLFFMFVILAVYLRSQADKEGHDVFYVLLYCGKTD
jgi:hypothetical protein